jgi:heme oxygenase (biliverdin-IX-beta and delta-forming)
MTQLNESLMPYLKRKTADLHRDIEAAFPLLRSELSVQRYRDFLILMYSFYVPLERMFDNFTGHGTAGLCLKQRQKTDLLRADLKSLGMTALDIMGIPVDSSLSGPCSLEELIGVLYVVEGSTLGGQVISRLLKKRLSLTGDQLHFFDSYGDQTAEMWHRFGALAEQLIDPSRFENVLENSRSTFISMTRSIQSLQS